MTTVDSVPDKINFNRLTPEQWTNESPRIVVVLPLEGGGIELYSWHYGQRISVRPQRPRDLWDWLSSYAQNPWETLIRAGLKPPENKPHGEGSGDISPRKSINLSELDLDELFKKD